MQTLLNILLCLVLFVNVSQSTEEKLCDAHATGITKTILLDDTTKEEIKKYFTDTYDMHTSIYHTIQPDRLWIHSEPLRHPVFWYAGHSASFYINKLRVAGIRNKPLNGEYEAMFAVGVDEMSWDDKLAERDDWPEHNDLFEYRKQVRKVVLDTIDEMAFGLPIQWMSPWWVILMGIEHERIHIETSSVIVKQIPIQYLRPIGLFNNECKEGLKSDNLWIPNLGAKGHAPINELIHVEGKTVDYGRKIDDLNHNVRFYGWDNEYGEMKVDVPSFKASKYLVSNEEYYEFVLDDGYTNETYWDDEGWKWVQFTGARMPKFWIDNGNGTYKLRRIFTEQAMMWDWPIITNALESEAFCRWKSLKLNKNIRLLTEDEWHVLRQLGSHKNKYYYEIKSNINLASFISECPINMFEFGSCGFYDIIGNVWQHTLTPPHPFKGFEPHPWYDDFTIPCFGSNHNLMKGGSFISTGNEAISHSRYQFRRHFYQHAGIRYVESDRDLSYLELLKDESPYTHTHLVNLYVHFHYYDGNYFGIPNYNVQMPEKGVQYLKMLYNIPKLNRALDLGCATGRASFQLAKYFKHVDGIDFTTRLLSKGFSMKENGFLEYDMKMEGDIVEHFKITKDDLGYDDALFDRVFFTQNDAQNLDNKFANYDLVLALNLIDRLNNPIAFIEDIHNRINQGGILLLCDPYTWLEEYTPKEKWLGGYHDEHGNPVYTFDTLKKLFDDRFRLVEQFDQSFVIQTTKRKYEHTNADCGVWLKL